VSRTNLGAVFADRAETIPALDASRERCIRACARVMAGDD
jgi:hypothetical protein